MKTQKERLEEIINTNHFNYKMRDIMLVFSASIDGYVNKSKTVKAIKKKVTKEEWNSLLNGITATFFMSLHAYKLPIDEALKFGITQGIIGVGIVKTKERKKK